MSFALPGLIAAAATLAILFLWLRRAAGMPLDYANDRSLHVGAMPRIGGIAMAGGIVAALPLLSFQHVPMPILAAASGLFIFSLADDLRPLPVVPRLLGQLLAAGVAVWGLGIPWAVALPAMLALAWMTNLYNFMDGADGLAGGMAVIGFGAYSLAAWAHTPELSMTCMAIAGAAIGFLAFNFPPAKVFMGDAGSIPLGFLAGTLGILGWREGIWPAWFPILVFSPFIVDATVTLWRRLLRGERVWQAHREHAYQRLILAGWTHRRLVLAAWVLMAAAAVTALFARSASSALQAGALFVWLAIYMGAWIVIERRTTNRNPGRA